jgi:MATE family multidrug resistance protein
VIQLNQYTKEFKRNFSLAFPIILGLVGHTLVGLVDNIMVGKLGTAELAAASLGNSFLFIAMSVILGYSSGITPLVAAADSSGNKTEIKSVLKNSILLLTVLSVVLVGIVFLAVPLLYHMDQTVEVVDLAIPYLNVVLISLIPLAIFQAFKQFADGLSQTKYSMIATIIANALNILLNYILIYGVWGFPELGIVGAAYGTLISRIFMVVIMFGLLYRNEKFKHYFIDFFKEKILKSIIRRINKLGFPSALQMFFEFGIFTAAIWLSGTLGKNPQAANQIALNLSSFTFMFAMGLGIVAIIRVGNQYGVRDYKNLKRIAISVFMLIFILDIVFAIGYMLFNEWLPLLYLDTNDPINAIDNLEVIAITSKLLIVAAFFQIFDGMQAVVLGALKGLQDVKIPTVIVFIAYWVIAFPICYYLGIHLDYGSEGIWVGLLIGLAFSAILLLIRFHLITKKMIRET